MTHERKSRPNTIPLSQLVHENRPVGKNETRTIQRLRGKYVDQALNANQKVSLPVDDWDWYFQMRKGIHP